MSKSFHRSFILAVTLLCMASGLPAQTNWTPPIAEAPHEVKLADVRLRDSCVWVDTNSKTYYLVSAGRRGPNRLDRTVLDEPSG